MREAITFQQAKKLGKGYSLRVSHLNINVLNQFTRMGNDTNKLDSA